MLMIVLLITIVVTILLLIFAFIYNRYQKYVIKINEAETYIDITLRKKFDILEKAVASIKANLKKDEKITEKLETLKQEKISNFELDRKLTEISNDFFRARENHPKLNSIESFYKTCNDLSRSEEELEAYRQYYNDNITHYNKLIRMFPTNLVGFVIRYKEKRFYDNKNLLDKNINDVKL
jgi:LemA protein